MSASPRGVRHVMFVFAMMWSKYSRRSKRFVLIATCRVFRRKSIFRETGRESQSTGEKSSGGTLNAVLSDDRRPMCSTQSQVRDDSTCDKGQKDGRGKGKREGGVYDLVLPLELCPHAAEVLCLAVCRSDVVHDVQLDVRQVHVTVRQVG